MIDGSIFAPGGSGLIIHTGEAINVARVLNFAERKNREALLR